MHTTKHIFTDISNDTVRRMGLKDRIKRYTYDKMVQGGPGIPT